LDTDIFVDGKDYLEILEKLNEFSGLINQKVTILKHPKSIEWLNDNLQNEKRQILSNFDSYSFLEFLSSPSSDLRFNSIIGIPKNQKEDIDNQLLYAVYKDAVTYLVTENKSIIKKSVQLGLKDRVLSFNEAIGFFREFYSNKKRNSIPQIKLLPIHKLSVKDPIFDSFRKDYPEFNEWYAVKSIEGLKCWCYIKEDDTIGAILIFSDDDYETIDTKPPLPKKRRFKIHALKVDLQGCKLGELLLKQAIDYCIDNSIDELYVNHYVKSEFDHLVNLVTEYGFLDIGLNSFGERVYFKELRPNNTQIMFYSYDDIFKKYYPLYYDGTQCKKLIVPVRPEYHEKLFSDYKKRTSMTLDECFGNSIVEGNTIKKAYISHSSVKNIKKGDILLFYRSGDYKEITSLGVLEEFKKDLTSPEEIMNLVGKRTVYSAKEIEEIAKKPATVMTFTLHFHLKSPISIDALKDNNILKGPPISITEITQGSYEKIKELGQVNQNLTIH